MTPQEREVIDGIFERLKPAATQPRDPEAERHIVELLRQQPYATYVLAQQVFVQEQALNNLNRESDELKQRLADAERKAAEPPPATGFLSGLFGGGAAAKPQAPAAPQGGPWGGQPRMGMQPQAPQPMMAAPQQGGPWGGQAAAAPAAGGGSGFLGTALTTAAGVAGGMVVGNMLMNAFKGPSASGSPAHAASSDFMPSGQNTPGSQTGNNSDTASHASYDDKDDDYDDSDEAGYDDGGYDSGGGDSYEA